jgi:hypothetical protein
VKINTIARLRATQVTAGNEKAIAQQQVYKQELIKVLKGFEAQNPAMKVGRQPNRYAGGGEAITIRICDDPSLVSEFQFDDLKGKSPEYATPWPSLSTTYYNQNGVIIHHDTAWYNYSKDGFPRTLKGIRDLKKTFPVYAERVIERHKQGGFHYGHD